MIDPGDLRWVWLTHDDLDHTGSLQQVLQAAPRARLVANPIMVLRLTTSWQVAMNRVYFLNPGESISVGDRKLTAVRPPVFDNPGTTGFYDERSGTFFSSDCFGALLSSPTQAAGDIPKEDLRQGQTLWATLDAPWLHGVDEGRFAKALDGVRQMSPKLILSSHLPPAQGGLTEQVLQALAAAPAAEPFVGPNQTALEEMLAQTRGGASGPAGP